MPSVSLFLYWNIYNVTNALLTKMEWYMIDMNKAVVNSVVCGISASELHADGGY